MNFDILTIFIFLFYLFFNNWFWTTFSKNSGFPFSKNCIGYHGIFGLFFLILYSYFSNLFYPHNLIHNTLLILIGVYSFYFFYFKNNYKVKNFEVFIYFLILFISFLLFSLMMISHITISLIHII